jgi:hypothetical protein
VGVVCAHCGKRLRCPCDAIVHDGVADPCGPRRLRAAERSVRVRAVVTRRIGLVVLDVAVALAHGVTLRAEDLVDAVAERVAGERPVNEDLALEIDATKKMP